MTDRDWEAAASAARLGRLVGGVVSRLRETADRIERDTAYRLSSAAKPTSDYHTYARVPAEVVHGVHELLFNLNVEALIDAASDADRAHAEKARKS